jgi:hypothetical protein
MYKAGVHPGIIGTRRARLNGLGGEALEGGALMGGNWRDKINAGGQDVALDRLRRLVTNPKATTREAREVTIDRFLEHAKKVSDLGWTHPEAPINFVYSTDRMPHWSLPLAGRSTIVPFYAPLMIPHIVTAMRDPLEYGELHKQLLSALMPSWGNVPFYKPSARTRAAKFMWEYDDWSEAKTLIRERIEQARSFAPTSVHKLLRTIQERNGTLAEETTLVRVLWEISFNDYLSEVAEDVVSTKRAVLRTNLPHQSQRASSLSSCLRHALRRAFPRMM